MNKKLLFWLILLIPWCAARTATVVDSLLTELDKTIRNSESYAVNKQKRIDDLKIKLFEIDSISSDYYRLHLELYKEYKSYTCDSAIHYLNNCIRIAKRMNNVENEYADMITLSHLLASAGMYKEAVDVIDAVKRNKLPDKFVCRGDRRDLRDVVLAAYFFAVAL